MKVLAVIPARWASTRFPGKPLVMIIGKPMIQHVYERTLKAKLVDEVIVATDDKRIFNAVRKFDGHVVMTSKNHKSGSDRIGEIASKQNKEIIVNVQGDEPFIEPKNIDKTIKPMLSNRSINVSTMCVKINDMNEINNPNIVKVVFDENNFALYFSRSPIPNNWRGKKTVYYKHVGLYVYRRDYLLKLIRLKQSKLESIENLEQLRILENGGKIKVVEVKTDSIAIDTPGDLKKIKRTYK